MRSYSNKSDFFDRLLPKPIRTEFLVFTSSLRQDELLNRIRALLDRTRGFVFTPNIGGRFISSTEFKAYPKWSLIVIRGSYRPSVELTAEVVPMDHGSALEISIRSNWVFGVLALAVPLVGVVWLVLVPKDHLTDISLKEWLVGLGYVASFPTISLLLAYIAKRRFLRTIRREFDLVRQR